MNSMITRQPWQCPLDLIENALSNFPISEEVSVLNEPTGNFFYDKWKIKDLYKNTLWKKVLDTLPGPVGQARIIKLKPGESYMGHADIDNRWHLNLTGTQSYLIDLDNKIMHDCIKDNYWYYMDAGRIHAATNYGSIPRLQLVVRELLVKSQSTNDLITVAIEPVDIISQYDFRYQFDNIFSPWLNRMNKQCKISDFSHTTSNLTFKLDSNSITELEDIKTPEFKITYG